MDGPDRLRRGRGPAGGSLSDPAIELAAVACAHGIPGWTLLTTSDPAEQAVLAALTERAADLRERLDRRLASMIRAEIRKLFP